MNHSYLNEILLMLKETGKVWGMLAILFRAVKGACNREYWLALAGEKSQEVYSF